MKTIRIDLQADRIPKDNAWQMCVGSGHAALALRRDWCEYVKRIHDELGIRYVRFHGIFDDDLLTAQSLADFIPLPNAGKIREYSFRQVGKVYDNVLATGMKPFVELSFMPHAFASGRKTGLHYKNNITPPKDYAAWEAYIERFIRFLLRRYGPEEVESWYFEVWNEPDLKVFFTGSQKEYFKLYRATASAIKRCDEKLRVGGPSTSASKWLPEFIAYVEKEGLACDFISTHQYPGDGFGNEFHISDVFRKYPRILRDAARKKKSVADTVTALFYDPDAVKRTPKGIMRSILIKARREAGKYPLFYTEWNCMSIFGAPGHDEKYSAAYAVKTILDLNRETDCFSFWCCSDLFEEILFINQPFHGGFGLINNLGIPKPVFWAMRLLNDSLPERIRYKNAIDSDLDCAVFTDGERFQVFLVAQSSDPLEDREYTVRLQLNRNMQQARVVRIDDTHCNPKRRWQELGSPMDPSSQEVKTILDASAPNWEGLPIITRDEDCEIELTLRTNDVIRIDME